MNTTTKERSPPKRPPNLDYLNRLSQPKSKSRYVLVKEGESDSEDVKEPDLTESQKKIVKDKEERQMNK